MISNTPQEREIVELHEFFEGWLSGKLPNTDDNFGRFTSVMGPGFHIVTPNGNLTERDALIDGLRVAHGTSSGLRIWIENVNVRQRRGDLTLTTYEEWQEESGDSRGRLSSVLFREKTGTPNGVEWLHVQETWLD